MASATRSSAVTAAVANVTRAEQALADAEHALNAARDELDVELSKRGWDRMIGVFDARLYQHCTNPQTPIQLDAALRAIAIEDAR
jgi:hypothetical protein